MEKDLELWKKKQLTFWHLACRILLIHYAPGALMRIG